MRFQGADVNYCSNNILSININDTSTRYFFFSVFFFVSKNNHVLL